MDFLAGDIFNYLHKDDAGGDVVDKISYYYTPTILVISSLSIMAILFVNQPIQCWTPPEFMDSWESYTETFCFVQSTYHTPECEGDECFFGSGQKTKVSFYQWVPLVLLLQAMLFKMPLLIWTSIRNKTGINVKSILNNAAMIKKKFDKGARNNQVDKAASHMIEALEMQQDLKSTGWFANTLGKRNGSYLVSLYCFTKVLYVVNVIVQFIIMNAFLGSKYTFWGYGILQDLINGKEWEESGHFPRVTMCDFNVRVLGNIHRWSVQCVLMINMFNEKIFIFFWFWFLLIGFISVLSMIWWTLATSIHANQKEFVIKYLRCSGAVSDHLNQEESDLVNYFTRSFLRADGVFLLRMIQTNGGDLLAGEMTNELFIRYKNKISDEHSKAVTDSPHSTNYNR